MIRALLLLVLLLITSAGHGKTGHAISLKVFKVIDEVETLVDQGKPKQALAELKQQLKRKLTPYEKAQLYYLTGSIHYRQSDTPRAIEAFKEVLPAKGEMPDYLYQRTLKTLAQLHLVTEEFEQALHYGQLLFDQDPMANVDSHTLLAQIHYRLANYPQARQFAESARELLEQRGQYPAENLLLLQNAIYFELSLMDNMVLTLKSLLSHYPKESYLLYLASVYGHLGQTDKQTALMESLYEKGTLVHESHLIQLTNLYLAEKVPHKAALLLQRALEEQQVKLTTRHYELLAQAWMLAAHWDKASRAMGQAAKLDDTGDLYLRQAQVLFEQHQWASAKEALQLGFNKGYSQQSAGDAWLLLGMLQFQQEQFHQAILACEKAKEYDKTRRHAENWINYIGSEKAKFDAMKAWE